MIAPFVDVFRHHVAGIVDIIDVVALAARHDVGTAPAIDHVVAGVADDRVGQRIAGPIDTADARQRQILQIRAQRVTQRGLHQIGALAGVFGDDVAGIVDNICVVASPAGHRIRPRAAIDHIARGVADDRVGQRIARAIGGGGARQRQILDIVAQGIADGGLHRIDALVRVFDHDVARLADDIDIVASAAYQPVRPRPAIQHVAGSIARQHVGECVAGGVDRRRARQRQVLDVCRQRVADRGIDQITALTGALDHHIARIVDVIGVVPGAPGHRIGARRAVDDVVRGIADDRIVERVAGRVGRAAGQGEILDMRAQRVIDRGNGGIVAFIRILDHHVTGIVDDIDIVARTADQRIRARAAIEHIVADVADQRVREHVATAVNIGGAGQREMFDIGGQRETDRAADPIDPLASMFRHHIAGIIDVIEIVTRAADHRVGAAASIQHIVAAVAAKDVGEGIAGAVDGIAAGQRKVLDVRRQRVADGGVHPVGPLAGVLDDDVAKVVDHENVVTRAADHRIRTRAAIDRVVAGVAGDRVVECVARSQQRRAGERQILDIGAQPVIDRRTHEIGAAVRGFDHHVADGVDHIAIVAGTPGHRIRARTAIEHVVPGVAGQHVIRCIAGAIDVGKPGQRQILDIGGQDIAGRSEHRVGAAPGLLDDGVTGIVDVISVIARAADQRVRPRTAIDRVGERVAGDLVRQRIARSGHRRARQRQLLDMRTECIIDRRADQIGSFARIFDHHVAGVVDHIQIVSGAPDQRVRAGVPIEPVIASVAGQDVIQRIAGCVDRCRSRQGQPFDIGRQRIADRRKDQIGALTGILDHRIAGIVDDKGIVADPARHHIRPRPAVQHVRQHVAGKVVVERIARRPDGIRPGQDEILDIRAQRIIDRGADEIDALAGMFHHHVADVVDLVAVVAQPPDQRVGAGPAIEHVVARVARDHVRQRVAGAADVGAAGQGQILDIGRQGEADRGKDNIVPLARLFDHRIGGVVDHIAIVALRADQRIRSTAAVQHIVAGIAGDHIRQRIAGARQIRGSGQGKVLDVGRQHMADRCDHRVIALAGSLGHHVTGIVHQIDIVAGAADHRVRPGGAIQHIGRPVAGDNVIERIARPVDRHQADQRQILDIAAERVTDRGLHHIDALPRQFDHGVPGIVDHIAVIARATRHPVRAEAAVEHVVAGIAGQDIVERVARPGQRGAGQRQHLDVRAQGIIDRGEHHVGAGGRLFYHHVAGIIDDIAIVARAARHRIRAGAAVEHVVSGVAGQDVIAGIAPGVNVANARQRQVFDIVAQCVADRGAHDIGAAARLFDDRIRSVVDQIGVVTRAADQRIRPRPTVDDIVGAIAGDDVVRGIARRIDRGGAGQRQILDVAAQRIADRSFDTIHTLVRLLDHAVAGVIDDINVVARAADHHVGTRTAVQQIVADIAGQPVVQHVAGAVDIGAAVERQVLDIRRERISDRRLDQINAVAAAFDDHVGGIVDNIGIVARPARHPVRAGRAVEQIVATVPGQRIVQRVARHGDMIRPGQRQCLDIGRQRIAYRGVDRVHALAGLLDHHVAGIVDNIAVVASAADHRIGAGAAIQQIVATVAGQNVVERISRAGQVVRPDKPQLFDIGCQRIVDRRLDQVDPLAGLFDDHIIDIIHHIGVIPRATDQRIGTASAIDQIVPAIPRDDVGQGIARAAEIAGTRQREILDIRRQPIVDGRKRQIGAAVHCFDQCVARIVDDIGIVTAAPFHDVRARAAIKQIVRGRTMNRVVARPAVDMVRNALQRQHEGVISPLIRHIQVVRTTHILRHHRDRAGEFDQVAAAIQRGDR